MSLFDAWFAEPRALIERLQNGPGTDKLDIARNATKLEADAQLSRAAKVELMVTKISAGWQGAAGTNAVSVVEPLRAMAAEDSTRLYAAEDLLDRQQGSFSRAVNELRPMADAPPAMPMDEAAPWDNDHDSAVRTYQDDVLHNLDVYRRYDGASEYNETNMPTEYRTGRPAENSVSVKPPPDTIEIDSGPGNTGPGGPGDDGGFGGPYPGSGPYPGGGPHPGGSGPGGAVPGGFPGGPGTGPGGQTTPNDWVAPAPGSPYAPGFVPPAPVGRESTGAGAPGMPGYVGGPGYGGGRLPGGGPGSGGPGAGGPGGGPGGPGAGRVVGPGPAVGAGALAADEAARRAAQTAAARGGVGPVGAPVAGGRGKDDEDAEHRRKVLLESDSEDTFGSDELTAPQVIGDDEYED